jgi:elongation factor Ts
VPADAWEDLEREHGGRAQALAAVALLDQNFIKNPKLTIRDLVKDGIAKLGENIIVRRFARFEVGAGVPAQTDEE